MTESIGEDRSSLRPRKGPSHFETASTNEDLVRRTLRTALVLVASCVAFVGTLTVVAVTVTEHALAPASSTPSPSAAPPTSGSRVASEHALKPTSI